MSCALLPTDVPPATARPAPTRAWLVGPAFDALFLANLAWPLVLLLQLVWGLDAQEGLRFWQLYFITTPHRWITLPLVFLDHDRFRERPAAFLGVGGAIIAVCLGVRFTTGALTCLLTIDYLWNAWHFAAQHHGVYRIYGRLSDPDRAAGLGWEKWLMRLFLLYVIVRVAGATWSNAVLESGLQAADWGVLAIPLWLVTADLRRYRSGGAGRVLYGASVCSLYVALLWAAHIQRPGLVLMLATASALFHAIEYLALVGWAVQRRHGGSPNKRNLLARMVPQWGVALAAFVVILGLGGWLLDQHLLELWLTINVIVAFMHYAYDGMIWKHRRPGSYNSSR
jgi:hypothetical protein